jgi:hypothetical protein
VKRKRHHEERLVSTTRIEKSDPDPYVSCPLQPLRRLAPGRVSLNQEDPFSSSLKPPDI